LTIEAATKFVPLIVSVKAAPPAAALFGEIVVIVGVAGVGGGGRLLTDLLPPPHPARDTRLTMPKVTSLRHQREGPEVTVAMSGAMTLG
jgi:hypothetical protein